MATPPNQRRDARSHCTSCKSTDNAPQKRTSGLARDARTRPIVSAGLHTLYNLLLPTVRGEKPLGIIMGSFSSFFFPSYVLSKKFFFLQLSARTRSSSHPEKSSFFAPIGGGRCSGSTMALRASVTSESVPGKKRNLCLTLLFRAWWKDDRFVYGRTQG